MGANDRHGHSDMPGLGDPTYAGGTPAVAITAVHHHYADDTICFHYGNRVHGGGGGGSGGGPLLGSTWLWEVPLADASWRWWHTCRIGSGRTCTAS